MDYGVAPESAVEAKKWLLKHNSSFGHFIGGAFTSPKQGFKSVNPSNGETIASLSQATNRDAIKQLKPLTMLSKVGRLSILTKERRYYTQLRGFYRKILVFFLFLKQSIMASQ